MGERRCLIVGIVDARLLTDDGADVDGYGERGAREIGDDLRLEGEARVAEKR